MFFSILNSPRGSCEGAGAAALAWSLQNWKIRQHSLSTHTNYLINFKEHLKKRMFTLIFLLTFHNHKWNQHICYLTLAVRNLIFFLPCCFYKLLAHTAAPNHQASTPTALDHSLPRPGVHKRVRDCASAGPSTWPGDPSWGVRAESLAQVVLPWPSGLYLLLPLEFYGDSDIPSGLE